MKLFWDTVYGHVKVTKSALIIIDTPYFQRLKSISQMYAIHLFPSANHTRFEHSVGVYHLATRFWAEVEKNVSKDDKSNARIVRYHFTMAALLHDIGHFPLSHLGERFADKAKLIKTLLKRLGSAPKGFEGENLDKVAAPHELSSCCVILKSFKSILNNIFNEKKIVLNMELICRMILGIEYKDKKHWLENVAVELLNSKGVDVDKLDYLLRDNDLTGKHGCSIDVEKLLSSLGIDEKNKRLIYKPKSVSVIQSIIECRDNLYLWVCNHHTVVYSEYLIESLIRHCTEYAEKEMPGNEYSFNTDDFFSLNAVEKQLVTDHDILSKFGDMYRLSRKTPSKISAFPKKILSQFYERKYIRALWKTIYDFDRFMSKHIKDKRTIDKFIEIISNKPFARRNDGCAEIVKLMLKKVNKKDFKLGDFFILSKSNKFYSMSDTPIFYIQMGKQEQTTIGDLLPQKKYKQHFPDMAFFAFVAEKYIGDVTKHFEEVISDFVANNRS